MKTLIERIRDQRIDHDLTQAQVAEILDISQQHYSLYEHGTYDLPLRHFETLVNYYNLSADYFLGRCKLNDKTGTDLIYINSDYTASQMIEDVLSLDPISRGIIIQHIAYLKQITGLSEK